MYHKLVYCDLVRNDIGLCIGVILCLCMQYCFHSYVVVPSGETVNWP